MAYLIEVVNGDGIVIDSHLEEDREWALFLLGQAEKLGFIVQDNDGLVEAR